MWLVYLMLVVDIFGVVLGVVVVDVGWVDDLILVVDWLSICVFIVVVVIFLCVVLFGGIVFWF